MTQDTLGYRLAEIARDIQSKPTVEQAGGEICSAARELLKRSTGAGITLVRRRGEVRTVGATSDLVERGDKLQYALGQGPCLDAAWEEEVVFAGDLGTDERWPEWGPRVIEELGVRSVLCVQLFTNEDQLGALNIYSDERYAFDSEDQEVARLLAAHGAVGVAATLEVDALKVAVDRRTTIGKALGIIMARYDVDDDQAMSTLRRLSSHANRKLYDIAVDVIRERRLPAPLAGEAGADG